MLNQTSDEDTEQSTDQKSEQSSGQSSDKSSVFVAVPAAAVSGWVPKGRNANGTHSHSASQTQKGRKYSAIRGIISAPFITAPFTTPAVPLATRLYHRWNKHPGFYVHKSRFAGREWNQRTVSHSSNSCGLG